jgi:spore coat protein U-like protein
MIARIVAALSAALGVALGGVAHAAQTTGTLTVTARMGGICLLNFFAAPTTVAFGTYTPTTGNRDATGTMQIRCANGIPFTIALNGGGSGNVTARQMSATGLPAEKLDYQLYTDATRTTVWGDGTGGSSLQSGIGGGYLIVRLFTVYGRIPDSGANLSAAVRADYRDTVTITVTY